MISYKELGCAVAKWSLQPFSYNYSWRTSTFFSCHGAKSLDMFMLMYRTYMSLIVLLLSWVINYSPSLVLGTYQIIRFVGLTEFGILKPLLHPWHLYYTNISKILKWIEWNETTTKRSGHNHYCYLLKHTAQTCVVVWGHVLIKSKYQSLLRYVFSCMFS